jgi:transcription termination factor 2
MGTERLNTIMKTIMLRRTKQELQQEGQLQCLPNKQVETIEVTLQPEEDQVYQHLLKKSKYVFFFCIEKLVAYNKLITLVYI